MDDINTFPIHYPNYWFQGFKILNELNKSTQKNSKDICKVYLNYVVFQCNKICLKVANMPYPKKRKIIKKY